VIPNINGLQKQTKTIFKSRLPGGRSLAEAVDVFRLCSGVGRVDSELLPPRMPRQQALHCIRQHSSRFCCPQKLRHQHCAPCSNQCGSVRVLRFDSDRGVASKRQADGRITFVRKGHEDPTSFSGSPGCWYLALPANYQYDGTKPHRWGLATWPGVKSITYFDRRILHAAVRRDSAL